MPTTHFLCRRFFFLSLFLVKLQTRFFLQKEIKNWKVSLIFGVFHLILCFLYDFLCFLYFFWVFLIFFARKKLKCAFKCEEKIPQRSCCFEVFYATKNIMANWGAWNYFFSAVTFKFYTVNLTAYLNFYLIFKYLF